MKKLEKKFLSLSEKLSEGDKYLFFNLFNTMKTHIKILEGLEKNIFEHGELIKKEYVKNRECLVANPAISQYNSTSKALGGVVNNISKLMDKINDDNNSAMPSILKKMQTKTKENFK